MQVRFRQARRGVLFALLMLVLLPVFTAQAATFTVTNTNDTGAGSFRQALTSANSTPGPDTINFSIPGTGQHTITPLTLLPDITDPVTITAEGEEGWAAATSTVAANLRVEISGQNIASANSIGLVIGTTAGGSTIRGLAINGFATGIEIRSAGNTVRGTIIGLALDGIATVGSPMRAAVYITNAPDNVIGGTIPAARNVLSGTTNYGIYVFGGQSTNNRISGNYIGVAADGTTPRGNGTAGNVLLAGIVIDAATSNVIGGNTSFARNVISANRPSGISVRGGSNNNTIIGNSIGTNAAGTAALGNEIGIQIENAINTSIGGTVSGERNVIAGSTTDGIQIVGVQSSPTTIEGNYIGTNASATAALNNGRYGVHIAESGNNIVGGTSTAARNIISGNLSDGVFITGSSAANNNSVQGNYIGTNAAGNTAIGNGGDGIEVVGVNSMTIGGSSAAARNLVSGNGDAGVYLNGTTTVTVAANYIGTNANGTGALPNEFGIVLRDAPQNTIGGLSASLANLISGNTDHGVWIDGASAGSNNVFGNLIGTTASGSGALGNGGVGVYVFNAPENLIGNGSSNGRNTISANVVGVRIDYQAGSGTVGNNRVQGNYIGTNNGATGAVGNEANGVEIAQPDTRVTGNVIGGNAGTGILIEDIGAITSNNVIQSNLIGVNTDGADLGNGGAGITINSFNNNIGGTIGSTANRIAFNGGAGITFSTSATPKNGATFRGNSIYLNEGLGIDLPPGGVTANDDGDVDTGANALQNTPVITRATQTVSNFLLSGTFNSTATTSGFLLDFYANPVCDPSGFGEGRVYLGSTSVSTNASGDVTFTDIPLPPSSGNLFITATATSALGNTSEFSNCVKVNNQPIISAIPDYQIPVNDVLTINFTVSDFETPANALQLSAASSNDTVIPEDRITFGGSGTNRSVTITPLEDTSGVSVIEITVTDGDGATVTETFTVTVTTAPTISAIADVTINVSSDTGPIPFTIGDAETDPADLTVTVSSSNTTIVPNSGIVIEGDDANRTVTVTPTPGQSGTVTITLTVSDGLLTATETFDVIINIPPTITAIADQTIPVGGATGALAFTIGDTETPVDNLTITVASSNSALIPVANVVIQSQGGGARTVTVTPVAGQAGSSVITLTVTDANGGTAVETFTVIVNTPPTISTVNNVSTPLNTPTLPIPFTVSDAETPAASLMVTATSSNTTVLPLANIEINAQAGGNRTVTLTPANNQVGSSTVTLTVTDANGGTASTIFTFSVSGAPSISNIPDQTTNINTTVGPIAFTVNDAETAPSLLVISATSSNETLVPSGNISVGGSGTSRTLTIVPASNQTGTTTITVRVTDGSGLFTEDTFVLTVNALPTISAIGDQLTPIDVALTLVPFTIGDAETPAASLTVTVTSSNQAIVPNGFISIGGSGANRSLNVLSVGGASGTVTITVTVSDANGGQTSEQFLLVITAERIRNGQFTDGLDFWGTFAVPANGISTNNASNDIFQFTREIGAQQAVILQNTGATLTAGTAISARLELGNTSSVRKRAVILIHSQNFRDSILCSFWLTPNQPLTPFRIRGEARIDWTGATISVYNATADSAPAIQLDNVSLVTAPGLDVNETLCSDPRTPDPAVGTDSANILVNGDFSLGLPPWYFFGDLRQEQNLAGVVEFVRALGTTPGLIEQQVALGGNNIPAGTLYEATLSLGNNSASRMRVVAIFRTAFNVDLQACVFWLEPNTPLQTHTIRGATSTAWASAFVSIYPGSINPLPPTGSILLDNVSVRYRPGIDIVGTECYYPGSAPGLFAPSEGFAAGQDLVPSIQEWILPTLIPTATPAFVGETPIAPVIELPPLDAPAAPTGEDLAPEGLPAEGSTESK